MPLFQFSTESGDPTARDGKGQQEEEQGQEPQSGEEPQQQGQPQYVTVDMLGGIQQQLQQLGSQVQQMVGANAAPQQQQRPQEAPKFREVTDQELKEAFEDGDFQQYNALMQARQAKQQYEQEQRVEQRIKQLEQVGLSSIAGLTRQMVTQQLPYYNQFKDQIDAFVQQLPPDQQLNPEVYKHAHNMVVGSPENMEKIIEQKIEQRVRQAANGVRTQQSGGRQQQRQGMQQGQGQMFELTEDEQDELAYKGYDTDQFARRLGYASWEDYMNQTAMG